MTMSGRGAPIDRPVLWRSGNEFFFKENHFCKYLDCKRKINVECSNFPSFLKTARVGRSFLPNEKIAGYFSPLDTRRVSPPASSSDGPQGRTPATAYYVHGPFSRVARNFAKVRRGGPTFPSCGV